MVTRLGQRPLPDLQQDTDSSVSRRMGLALGQLGLAFAPDVRLSRYWANAVLQPHDGVTDPIVLANEGLHCFRNKDDRCVCKTSPCINLLVFHLCMPSDSDMPTHPVCQNNDSCFAAHVSEGCLCPCLLPVRDSRSQLCATCCGHATQHSNTKQQPSICFHLCRLTGRAVFRRAFLAKHGKLVLIPQHKLSSSDIDELAAYLQQELEAVAGGSLEAYRC